MIEERDGQLSTNTERANRARELLILLLGRARFQAGFLSYKKPEFFPSGITYTTPEWGKIGNALAAVRYGKVSIAHIWDLEEIANNPKYYDHIILNKLKS